MKEKRLMKIREIVSQRDVETQEDLVQTLEESGFPATQATVSRDIKELQLIKVVGLSGKYKYAIPMPATPFNEDTFRRKLSEVFISVVRAQNLLVIKVMPGNAHSIGAMLDTIRVDGLVGTIAGDDTLLLITVDNDAAASVERWLSNT